MPILNYKFKNDVLARSGFMMTFKGSFKFIILMSCSCLAGGAVAVNSITGLFRNRGTTSLPSLWKSFRKSVPLEMRTIYSLVQFWQHYVIINGWGRGVGFVSEGNLSPNIFAVQNKVNQLTLLDPVNNRNTFTAIQMSVENLV